MLLDGLARHSRHDPRRHAALRLRDPARRLRLADRHLPRRGDPRAQELPDDLPVAPVGRRLPQVRLERRADPVSGTSSAPGCSTSAAKLDDSTARASRAGTPAAPASTARSRWSTPTPPGAIWPPPAQRRPDEFAPYRGVDAATCCAASSARRLEAMEHVADDFRRQHARPQKTPFDLPDLAAVRGQGPHPGPRPARVRHHRAPRRPGRLEARRGTPPPERRVLTGETLLVRYLEADQEPGVAAQNREQRAPRRATEPSARRVPRGHPDAKQVG